MMRLLRVLVLVFGCVAWPQGGYAQEEHDFLYHFFGFADYAVEVPNIKYPKMPKLKRGDTYFDHRSAIKASAAEPINFAGHLKVVEWGCGTECQNGVIINVLDGTLTELPPAAAGYSYYVDSSLLVTNSHISEDPPDWMEQRLYYWDGEQLVFIKKAKYQIVDGGE